MLFLHHQAPSSIWLIYFSVDYVYGLKRVGILPSVNGTESAHTEEKNGGLDQIKGSGFNFWLGCDLGKVLSPLFSILQLQT